MRCPHCGGYAQYVELITEEESIEVQRCLNCGYLFGNPLLDVHHGIHAPPEPRPDALTPVYD